MEIETIGFIEVVEILKNDFGLDRDILATKYSELLDIPFFIEVAEKRNNGAIDWKAIANWYEFEYKDFEYSHDEIVAIFYPFINLQNDIMILITMESYKIKKGFLIKKRQEFDFFIENYDQYCGEFMPFMQNSDYIVLFPVSKNVILLHHEGYMTAIKL